MEVQGVPVTIANLAIHRHREEEMNRERMRHNQTVQEAVSQRAREANKGKAREVVPDSEEEESEEMYSSPSEEWIVLFSPLFLVGTIPTSPWYYLNDSMHLPRSQTRITRWETTHHVARTKFVEERPASQRARTRAVAPKAARAAAEKELTPFSDVIYDSREHYERSKLMRTKKVLNERIVQIPGEGRDFMIQRIHQLGWDYMYNDLVDINVTIVKEFYSNFSKSVQRTVYLRGTQINIDEESISSFLGIQDPIPKTQDTYEINKVRRATGDLNMNDVLATIATPRMTWDRYNPKSGRVDNEILKREARGWMKMMVCNLKPLRHETTYSWDTIMLFFTLMDGGCKPRIVS
ncbi:hypothetical protein PIB30_033425 [Stylosanthes scabra]|uniref:Putative plant transposon protein domain-containing protein n=1 Tax=Stylosanthes scabra TaxID=79078 RepID=A0ABU6SC69_9FABA|nr:hypothetical protein [Stylosanthes scabra]